MTRDQLINEYFDWMYDIAFGYFNPRKVSYRKLATFLHSVDFTYSIPMDGNRADDGIDLRYRFGYERNIPDTMIATFLDDRPCSVLEMMIALAIRCEEHIMDDPDKGDRTDRWFRDMLESLDIADMNDRVFDKYVVGNIIYIFLDRDYRKDGKGGLFYIKNCRQDLREVEIWYQLCMYLDDIL